jgi:hypothetical protein
VKTFEAKRLKRAVSHLDKRLEWLEEEERFLQADSKTARRGDEKDAQRGWLGRLLFSLKSAERCDES